MKFILGLLSVVAASLASTWLLVPIHPLAPLAGLVVTLPFAWWMGGKCR